MDVTPEQSLVRLNRLYSMLSQTNKLLLRATDRKTLFEGICRIVVEVGGFRFAWIGVVGEDERLQSVARAGDDATYIDSAHISARAGEPAGEGPSGTALRRGQPVVSNDFLTDPTTGPWRAAARQAGIRASAALPLREGGRVIGVLNLYATETGYFTERDLSTLEEMVEDVSFGLDTLQREAERHRAETRAAQWHARLAQVLDAGPLISYALEPDGDTLRVAWVSASVEPRLGYTVAEAMASDWWPSNVHPDDRARANLRVGQLQHLGAVRQEYRIRRKDGEYRWVIDDLRTVPGVGEAPWQAVGVWTDITDRKRMEAALLENDTRRREAERIAHLGSWEFDAAAEELIWSPEALSLLEVAETLRGPLSRALDEVVHPEDRPAAQRWFAALRDGERTAPLQLRLRPTGGPVRHIQLAGELFRRPAGYTPRGLGTVQDVSARAAAELALRESEERLRLALAAGRQGLWDLQVATGEATVNAEYATMLGEDPATFRETNDAWFGRMHPDDRPGARRAYEDYVAGRSTDYRVEFRQRTRDGHWRWILSVGRAVEHDREGRPLRMLGTHTDISALKQAEALMALNAQRAEAVIGLPWAAEALDEAGFLQYSADVIERLTGSRVSFLHFVNEDQETVELVAWSKRTLAEYCTAAFDGHYPISRAGIWAESFRRRAAVVFNDYDAADDKRGLPTGHAPMHRLVSAPVIEGGVVRMLTGVGNKDTPYTADDVTTLRLVSAEIWRTLQRRRAEAALRVRESALEAAANAIVIADRSGRVEWANQAFLALSGDTAAEAVGRGPDGLLGSGTHPPAFYAKIWETIRAGQVWDGEVNSRRKDGAVFSERLTITPVRNADGEIGHFIAVKRDLTEERALQDRLLQSQKLESVGRLAGGVAHDFNNLLTVINGTVDLARRRLRRDDPLDAELADVLRAGERASALTRQLLAFSRRQVLQRQVVRLNTTITELSKMLARLIGEDIELVTDFADDLGSVFADPGQIEQVVVNLVVNARDAMPRGGRLTLTTRNVVLDAASAALLDDFAPGECVALRVADTGIGMDDATKARVFEPFFTTKGVGKGTGLGLATVYGIVQQSGGRIRFESTIGQGTHFEILLRRVDAELTPRPQAPPRPSPESEAGATILLVDDEAALLAVGARMLTRIGYRVLKAGHAAEAMALVADHPGEIDLLLTDVVMPGVSGPELADRLRASRPGLKVLFTSGYAGDVIARHGMSPDDFDFIRKPYTVDELAEKVRAALAGS